MMRCKLEVVGKDPVLSESGAVVDWKETGRYTNEYDLETQQFAQFVLCNIFGVAQTIKNTSGTGESISAFTSTGTYNIVAGTGTSAVSVTDTNLQAQSSGSSGSATATIGSYSGSGSSGTFTITATITNSSGSSITYGEVGIELTASTYVFLLTHDLLSPTVPVSNTGTLAVTYTLTFE